jgi:hypothetical protein
MKQFLLNPDGSIPRGVDIELLKSENIPLVIPTPVPYEYGMVAVEQDPKPDEHEVLRQVWKLEPVPVEETVENTIDPLQSLTPEQKAALLALLQNT